METKHPGINELVTILFFVVESTNNIKIEIRQHRVVGNGCIWEGILLVNACWVSQSVFCKVLNPVNNGAFKRNFL